MATELRDFDRLPGQGGEGGGGGGRREFVCIIDNTKKYWSVG